MRGKKKKVEAKTLVRRGVMEQETDHGSRAKVRFVTPTGGEIEVSHDSTGGIQVRVLNGLVVVRPEVANTIVVVAEQWGERKGA